MKLINTVQNEAIVSNVGEIGEFRIRNSAKAFNILSSGLYANKIRAIIRELSCNAVDSHVAAGKGDTPFDIHLPNSLEPYFSIRDYGTGLNHSQVTNIYTTYFESTKTDSNEFIGALGLGSKSPFSYTDNFTVTAIKDGRKGIYTAFINEQGVPSIALMMEEETTDPAGVEVRFAVEDRYDFDKFRSEAVYVYEYFKLRPVVSGNDQFSFKDPGYTEKDIIPGVHTHNGYNKSYAIMGNIKYPIDIPNSDKALGKLENLLCCSLVMEFDIGELDFQASREGLSYIPETINAIKNKLEQLNGQLFVHIYKEAEKISNQWSRALYLARRYNEQLWRVAVEKYIVDTKFELFNNVTNWGGPQFKRFHISEKELASKYNIEIRAFHKSGSSSNASTLNQTSRCSGTDKDGKNIYEPVWEIGVGNNVYFVVSDINKGPLARVKYHWKNHDDMKRNYSNVYVLVPVDKKKPLQADKFFKILLNPPKDQIFKVSDLIEKPRARGMAKNVTIMNLERGNSRSRYDSAPMVWRDAGKADSFDSNKTYYYLPLCGFKNLGVVEDVRELHHNLNQSEIYTDTIYGVRKSDIKWVKTQKNWVNLDEYVKEKLKKLDQTDVMGLVKRAIDWNSLYEYDNGVSKVTDTNSPYLKLYREFANVKAGDDSKRHGLQYLCKMYKVKTATKVDPTVLIKEYKDEMSNIYKRYPLLKSISRYSCEGDAIAEYINLIDSKKGV